jgi:ABC-type molybdate transport system substrate-binding protein
VQVGWDETKAEFASQNRIPNNAAFARSGQAILNDFTIQANNRTNIQVTRQYMGSGALA